MNNYIKGTALITGASSGIGATYADRLAWRGYDLILVARNRDRLGLLASKLSAETGRSIRVVAADLTDSDQLRAIEDVVRNEVSLTMLVNNAGFGAVSPLLQSSVERMDKMIAINVQALTHLTCAAAPGFAQRGQGTIINIASIAAISPEALNAVYGGTKAYVLALTRSLHHELQKHGVRVQAVLPGATATEFWDIAGSGIENLPAEIVMSAQDMVDAALSGLDQGEVVTIPSLPDFGDFEAFECARRQLSPNLSHAKPAERYRVRRR